MHSAILEAACAARPLQATPWATVISGGSSIADDAAHGVDATGASWIKLTSSNNVANCSNIECGEHEQDETVGDAAREEVDDVVVNAIIKF